MLKVKLEYCAYAIFYKEFKKYFNLINQRDKEKSNFLLAFIFLYTTFECLITKTIRDFLYITGIPHRELFNEYIKIEENDRVSFKNRIFWFLKKIDDGKRTEYFRKRFKNFYPLLSRPRNKIIHGYEISYSGSGQSRSQLTKLLTENNIKKARQAFNVLIKDFFEIIKNFNVKNIEIKLVQPNQQFLLDITDNVINNLEK